MIWMQAPVQAQVVTRGGSAAAADADGDGGQRHHPGGGNAAHARAPPRRRASGPAPGVVLLQTEPGPDGFPLPASRSGGASATRAGTTGPGDHATVAARVGMAGIHRTGVSIEGARRTSRSTMDRGLAHSHVQSPGRATPAWLRRSRWLSRSAVSGRAATFQGTRPASTGVRLGRDRA